MTTEVVIELTPGSVAALRAEAAAAAAAADRVQTGLDATATAADAVATAADRVQTGLDATATAADRVQTGLDATRAEDAADLADSEGNATAAQVARAGAEAAEAEAEAARDTAETYAGVVSQATSAAGLTDPTTLSVGDKGIVSGSGSTATDGLYEVQDNTPNEWVRVGGTGLTGATERITDLETAAPFVAGVDSDLRDVMLDVRMYSTDATLAKEHFYIRQFFLNDVGTRINCTIAASPNADLSSGVDIARFAINGVDYSGEIFQLPLETLARGVTGYLRLHVPTSIDVYTTTDLPTLATRRIRSDRFTVVGANPYDKRPFADDADVSADLRTILRDIYVMDVEPGHTYSVPTLIVDDNGLKKRLRIEVRDNTDGLVVCSESWSTADNDTVADLIAALPEWLVLTDVLISPSGNKERALAHVRLDLSGVTDTFANVGATTATIHPDAIYSADRQGDYLSDDRVDDLVPVGASETLTTWDAALNAVYSDNWGSTNINGQPISNGASYARRQRIRLVDEATYTGTLTKLPNYVELDGAPGATLHVASPATAGALEWHGAGKISNITVSTAATDKNALHVDDAGRSQASATKQYTRLPKALHNFNAVTPAGSTVQTVACGISGGEVWDWRGLSAISLNPGLSEAAIGIHNTGARASVSGSVRQINPATINAVGWSSPNQLGLQLYAVAPGPVNQIRLTDCEGLRLIENGCSIAAADAPDLARERHVWDFRGQYLGPILRNDDADGGTKVLATTPGQTPSGDAAALIFGTVDDLGRGEKCLTGTGRNLGARLGDCSGTSKTLTIGGQTHTFDEDETAKDDATLVSEINTDLTTHPVEIVDIQHEWIAAATPQRRITNSTGATIPKGRLVKFTGASTVALCGADERPEGWTYRDILDGDAGIVAVTRRIAHQIIEGASSSTGEWGITTAGTLNYAASTKLGRTIGGIVEIY